MRRNGDSCRPTSELEPRSKGDPSRSLARELMEAHMPFVLPLTPLALLALIVPSPQVPAQTTPTYLDVPMHVDAPVSPIAFPGDDGKVHLAFHLFLTNWGHDQL